MTATEQMDRIVTEVLRRLAAKHPATALPADTLRLRERVITMSTLEGKLNGIRRLVISPRAVVTPSVHDALHAGRIELKRVSVDDGLDETAGPKPRLVVANLESTDVSSLSAGHGR